MLSVMPSVRRLSAPVSRVVQRSRSVAVTALLISLVAFGACNSSDATGPGRPSDPSTETFASELGVNLASMTERADKLYIQDLVQGTGAEAVAGRRLRVRYTGWLASGSQFDSNVSSGAAFEFVLGGGRVIAGWDIGVPGMRVGGKRRLVFGSEYGYGPQGSGQIPPNATLVFDVELVSIVN